MRQPHYPGHINYPSRIWQPPTYWEARAGATADDAPLPRVHRTARRTVELRQVFLTVLHGRATIVDILNACDERGLLDGLTDLSAMEITKRALRPICTRSYVETAAYQARVSAGSGRGWAT